MLFWQRGFFFIIKQKEGVYSVYTYQHPFDCILKHLLCCNKDDLFLELPDGSGSESSLYTESRSAVAI